MTPEIKKQIRDEIRKYYKIQFPEYPNLRQPRQALAHLPRIYQMLEGKNLINNQQISYRDFEAIAVDKFQEAQLGQTIASFF
jgi:hypothetical protein